ncbi:hypothetical protein [Streptomyces roseoverticillatus]|uniref:Zinc ribbon domain-containing protein n=1 Tax=Streptomyces roseoverticillatus TaxID=66429 RepID=A0ABV3ILT9_9ACTN
MSSYQYRCAVCGITWDEVTNRRQAEQERDRHRREAHDGGVPDGDGIRAQDSEPWPGRGLLLAGLLLMLFVMYSSWHGQ